MAATASSDPQHCPACTEPFDEATNPAGFAPCFHPLCQRCIDKTATNASTKPRQCLWLIEGVYCMTPFTAAQLISGKAAVAAPLCGSCENAPATHRCNDCNLDLCAAEAATHQMAKANRTHSIVVLDTAVTGQLMCTAHPTNAATQFCDKCDQPACIECPSATHAGHPIIALAAGLAKRANKTADTINRLLKPKREQCLTTIAAVRAQIDRLVQHKATAQQKIREAFDPLIEPLETAATSLKTRKAQLYEQIATTIDADIKTLTAQYDEMAVSADHLRLVEETQQQVHPDTAAETKRAALASRISTLSTIEIPTEPVIATTCTFVMTGGATPASVLTMDIASLGQIQTVPVHNDLAYGRSVYSKRNYESFNQPVRSFGSKGNGAGQFNLPWGLAVNLEGNLIVGDQWNNRIQIVTQGGQHVRFFQASARVLGVAVEPNGSIWAALGQSRLDLIHPVTGMVERTINRPGAADVCRLHDGAIVVGCDTQNKVICFNPDGTTRWSSTGRGFNYALDVTAIPDQQLVAVCDYGNKRIQLLSLRDGQFVRFIATSTQPRAVLFDPVAQILLVGEGSCISAWNLDGQRIHQWAQGSVNFVGGMAIASDGTLFACDLNHHRIIVF